ncbi:MAG: cell division ATP-binding protein FtsE [Coxiella sp. (in: Bacteria)]|nr:MAG: cell division ATP-binding protein FtsE [Coxiella sp. (in: g-proteobacteria)]
MIEFANVSKTYRGTHALNSISLKIEQGEMAFVTGHSGAGKSTLLKLIHHIEKPSNGEITVNTKRIHKLRGFQVPKHRRGIGIIFQNPHLIDNHTVYENVAMPLIITRYRDDEIAKRVRAALDKVGLLKKEKKYPQELSAGERQRVGIARAIVNKPPILLADEPTGNLDPELSLGIMRLFQAFNAVGVTILVATHDLPLIARLNHRIITLKEGQVIGDGNE